VILKGERPVMLLADGSEISSDEKTDSQKKAESA